MSSANDSTIPPSERKAFEVAQSVASVVAPLTVIGALLTYAGWVRTRAYYGYFGLSSSIVSFSPQDYLFQSAGVGFGGLLLVALATAILLILDGITRLGIGRLPSRQEHAERAVAILGGILAVSALGLATSSVLRAATPSIIGAMVVAFGTLLYLRFGASLPWHSSGRMSALPTMGCVALLLITLFWALTSYAQDLGHGAARDTDNNIGRLPSVTIYSREPIDFAGGGNIKGSRIVEQDEKWTYRYTGARLLLYSNNRWFLIPKVSSDRYRSSVTALLDNEKVRVETSQPR
jgi:hypothetical protein